MPKTLKFGLVGLGTLLALVAVVVAVGVNIDPTLFKDRLAKAVTETTGLEVAFNGPIKATYFPTVGIELSKVAVSSPAQAGGGVLAAVGKAEVSVKVLPLLSGKIQTGKLSLDGLELNIVRDAQGRLNLPVPPAKEVKIENDKVVVITEADQRVVIDYQIEGVSITNARIRYTDRLADNAYDVTDLALATGAVVKGKTFPVKLSFGYKAAKPDVSGRMELSGQASAVPEAMRFAFENAAFKTTLAATGLPVKTAEATYTGTVRIDGERKAFSGENLAIAAKAAGGALPDAGAGFSLAANATADMQAGTFSLTGLTLDAMGFVLSGSVQGAELNQAAKFSASLATNEFNPKQVLEKFGVTIAESGSAKASLSAAVDTGKDTADLTGLSVKALGLDIGGELHATGVQAKPAFKGRLTLAECNPRRLMASLGSPLPPMADPAALTRLQLSAAIEGAGDTLGLRTESFKLDGSEFAVDLKAEKAARPNIRLSLKTAALDADRYMPTPGADKADKAAKAQADPKGASAGVPADLDASIDIGKLKAAKLHMQNVAVRFSVKDSQLNVSQLQLALYQGQVKASARADLRGGPNAPLSLVASAEGVQVEQLLTDLEGKSKLTGRASLNAALAAKGQEAKHIRQTLSGKASFALRNGAILGFDLSPDAFSTAEKLAAQGKGQGRTNFDQVSASFSIAGGVAVTRDLLASVPPHKVTGQGSVDLAAETLDMKLLAAFAKLAPIPVRVSGALASPSVSVDAQALATGAVKGVLENVVKSPQDALKAPESVGKGALDAVGNILGLPKKK